MITVEKQKPQVLFFVPSLSGGGAEINTVRISNALKKMGVKVEIAVGRPAGSYICQLDKNIPVHYLTKEASGSSTLDIARCVLPLANLIRRRKPEVVCPVMISSGYVASLAAYLLNYRPVMILSVQNTVYNPLLSRIQRAFLRLLNSALLKDYDKFIAISDGVNKEIQSELQFSRLRTETIYNAISKIPTKSRERKDPTLECKTRIRYIACGRLTKQKGYEYLLKAFAIVRVQLDAELKIIGEGPDAIELMALTKKLGIQRHVEYLGFRNDAQEIIASADVFVLSSLWEGFGNVIIEAMSAGTPVIATNCPHGPGEIIRNGFDGILVPPANANELALAMLRVANDRELRKTMGNNGVAKAREFLQDKIAEKWLRVLGQ